MFGIWQSRVVSCCSACALASSSSLLFSFSAATSAFAFSAASLSPCFISMPMRLASFFCSERHASNSCCDSRRFLSTAMTSSIACSAFGKCFLFSPAITRAFSSVISFNVSILCYNVIVFVMCVRPRAGVRKILCAKLRKKNEIRTKHPDKLSFL